MATTQTKAPAKARTSAAKGTKAAPATTVAPTLQAHPAMPAFAAPAPAAALAAALANPQACTYALGTKVDIIAPHLTLQRGSTAPVGAQWRANGFKATNTRHVVIHHLLTVLGAQFTHAQAITALAPLKANGTLGSGTPASYVRAFVKCGYLVPIASNA